MKKIIGITLLVLLLAGTVGFVAFNSHVKAAAQTETAQEKEDCCKSCCSME